MHTHRQTKGASRATHADHAKPKAPDNPSRCGAGPPALLPTRSELLGLQHAAGNDAIVRAMSGDHVAVQREFERSGGRPVGGRQPFRVPRSRELFANEVAAWCDNAIMDPRAPRLVDASPSFDVLWDSIRRRTGETVDVRVNFVWGDHRVERLDFVVPTPAETPSRASERSGKPEGDKLPPPQEQTMHESGRRVGTRYRPADPDLPSPKDFVEPADEVGLAAMGIKVLVEACRIPQLVRDEHAAGLGAVDYAWIISAWLFADPGASSHSAALVFADAWSDPELRRRLHAPSPEDFRAALGSARGSAMRVWIEDLSPADKAGLRGQYSGATDHANRLVEEIAAKLPQSGKNYVDRYHPRWRDRRTFFRE